MDRPLFQNFRSMATEADVLLAEVLAKVQLPPSDYAKAESRYHTLADWLERDGSPLQGLVVRVYGQGGVAQGSSIASRATNDEFDVDAMVELHPSVDRGPDFVLDLLDRAVRGEMGSRYHEVTTRCTRCVQVQYADKMHVDLTPAILQPGTIERQSTIFHHRHETPDVPGKRVTANPFGFTAWFKAQTPPEPLFQFALDEARVVAKADAEPLPKPVGAHGMSRALASLQLIKRYRNLRYDRRTGRCPPSVLLARLIAGHRAGALAFATAVLEHSTALRDRFARHVAERSLIHEYNPAPCPQDVLTDRWPSSMADQLSWLADLNHLVAQLSRYVHGEPTLSQRQDILADLFGESAAKTAVLEFADRMGRGKELGVNRYQPGTGRLILPGVAAATTTRARPVPPTTYYGGPEWRG